MVYLSKRTRLKREIRAVRIFYEIQHKHDLKKELRKKYLNNKSIAKLSNNELVKITKKFNIH